MWGFPFKTKYFLWSEGVRIPPKPVHTFILDLPQIEVQKVDIEAIKWWLRPYYSWQILKSKRQSAFARFQGQSMIAFTNSPLVKQLELYHEKYSRIPKILLLDDIIWGAFKAYITKTSPWILFAYDEEEYTSLCVFKNGGLVLKRRFLKQYDFVHEIQSTLKYLARHGYMGEKVVTYYLDAPHTYDPVDNITIVQVPCDRLKVVEEGLKNLRRHQRIKTPLIPSMTEATAEEKLRRGLYQISLPVLILCVGSYFLSPWFVSVADETMQTEYNAVSKKDEKVILFEQLSHLNVTPFDVAFLKKIKAELGSLTPMGVQVDLRQQMMQLSIKAPDHVLKQKAMKLNQNLSLFKVSIQKNILTLVSEQGKGKKGGNS